MESYYVYDSTPVIHAQSTDDRPFCIMTIDSPESCARTDTPCGPLWIGTRGAYITRCDWRKPDNVQTADTSHPLIAACIRQLTEYFNGTRHSFSLPVAIHASAFAARVLQTLMNIGYGETVAYSGLARMACGNTSHTRCVAHALASNLISILIPCHRVVRADGTPGDYRGGREAKQYLLDLEQSGYHSGKLFQESI